MAVFDRVVTTARRVVERTIVHMASSGAIASWRNEASGTKPPFQVG